MIEQVIAALDSVTSENPLKVRVTHDGGEMLGELGDYGEDGMLANVVSFSNGGGNGEYILRLDFFPHLAFNKPLAKANWHDKETDSFSITYEAHRKQHGQEPDYTASLHVTKTENYLELTDTNPLIELFVQSGESNYIRWLENQINIGRHPSQGIINRLGSVAGHISNVVDDTVPLEKQKDKLNEQLDVLAVLIEELRDVPE